MKKPDFKKILRITINTAAVAFVAVFASHCFAQSNSSERNSNSLFYKRRISTIMDYVHENYVDEVDQKVLYEGAIKGLMNSLNDPYTTYLDSEIMRDLTDTTSGKFGGVGLSISKPNESTTDKPAYVEVASPIEDSPGAKAGIAAGDKITEIDDLPTASMTMQEVLDHLRGDVGTDVKVSILRGKNTKWSTVLTRALIEVPTIKSGMLGKTGYMRIIQFTPDTPERAKEAIASFENAGYTSLIIDLRDNPGGLISSVATLADFFIDEGPIVSTKSRDPKNCTAFTANPSSTIVKDKPIVVLINRGSASASEILSGALKDNHLAYLVGQRTYGKGSVQQVIPFSEDEGIKITVARYYTPSDTNIDKIGIPPDEEIAYPNLTEEEETNFTQMMKDSAIDNIVEETPEMSEAQISAAADVLYDKYKLDKRLLRRLIRIHANKTKPAALFDLDYDIQLKRALEIIGTTSDFSSLVHSTKTLKELQQEAEANKAAEEKASKK